MTFNTTLYSYRITKTMSFSTMFEPAFEILVFTEPVDRWVGEGMKSK